MIYKDPEFVQDLTETQGIGLVIHEFHDEYQASRLSLTLYYGLRNSCEFHDDACSHDGLLWSDNDRLVFLCTSHEFDEQLGYEFYEVNEET